MGVLVTGQMPNLNSRTVAAVALVILILAAFWRYEVIVYDGRTYRHDRVTGVTWAVAPMLGEVPIGRDPEEALTERLLVSLLHFALVVGLALYVLKPYISSAQSKQHTAGTGDQSS